MLYVENNCKKGSRELIDYVNRLGYICHWHVNPYFSETNAKQNNVNLFGEANSINMLCYSRNDQRSVERAEKLLPSITRIDVESGRYMLHEYNLSYAGKEDATLTQMGTLEYCER